MIKHVDAAQTFFERERGLRFQGKDEAVHELFGGEIDHAAFAHRDGMRHGLQQMRFAEPDRGMNIKRVVDQRLIRRPMSQSFAPQYGRADWTVRRERSRSSFFGQAASRSWGRCRLRPAALAFCPCPMASMSATVQVDPAVLGSKRVVGSLAPFTSTEASFKGLRAADRLDATTSVRRSSRFEHPTDFIAQDRQHAIDIMRLDPALQKFCRHGEMRRPH